MAFLVRNDHGKKISFKITENIKYLDINITSKAQDLNETQLD